jgi:hypothetical protein
VRPAGRWQVAWLMVGVEAGESGVSGGVQAAA